MYTSEKSEQFDESNPTKTYNKFRHIIEALKYVELAPDAAIPDAINLSDNKACRNFGSQQQSPAS